MCLWIYEQNWKELKGKLNRNDVVLLQSLHDLCRDEGSVVDKLEFCSGMAVQLKLQDTVIDEQLALGIIDLIHHEEEHKRRELRKAQRRGIALALERRKTGVGTYGRPHVDLPADFADQILRCNRNARPLEAYRKEIGLKKSTFYKYAKQVRERSGNDEAVFTEEKGNEREDCRTTGG